MRGFRSGTAIFARRSFLESWSFFSAEWPEADSMSIEPHETAVDFNDEVLFYLVVTFEDSPIRRRTWKTGRRPCR